MTSRLRLWHLVLPAVILVLLYLPPVVDGGVRAERGTTRTGSRGGSRASSTSGGSRGWSGSSTSGGSRGWSGSSSGWSSSSGRSSSTSNRAGSGSSKTGSTSSGGSTIRGWVTNTKDRLKTNIGRPFPAPSSPKTKGTGSTAKTAKTKSTLAKLGGLVTSKLGKKLIKKGLKKKFLKDKNRSYYYGHANYMDARHHGRQCKYSLQLVDWMQYEDGTVVREIYFECPHYTFCCGLDCCTTAGGGWRSPSLLAIGFTSVLALICTLRLHL